MNFSEILGAARAYQHARISAQRANGEECDVPFGELLDAADRLGSRLGEAGIGRGMQIALQTSNCYEYLVWDLAAVKTGAVIHAIPEDLHHEQVHKIVRRYAFALCVFEKSEHCTGLHHAVEIARSLDPDLPIPVDRSAVCLPDADVHTRVYSSGSSGYLKGLEISREGAERLVTSFLADFRLGPADSHLIFLPLSNYQQRLSVYGCLWSGAGFKVSKPATVFQDISRYRPTFIIAPPAIYENAFKLLGRGSDAKAKLNAFLGGNIRFMITGMAPIRRDVLEKFNELGFVLLEAYGVTETGMIAWSTADAHRTGSVGRPIDPSHVHFADDGEIIIRRPHPLSKGYFDSPQSDSASTFLPNGDIATGDIGELDADGYLSLRGRKKEIIVTSGGMKFHPEEIERSLCTIGPVQHAIVMMTQAGGRLAAVLFADRADPDTATAIENELRRINADMPAHKSVQRWVVSDTAPSVENGMLTRNLKYDRKGIYRFFEAEIGA